MSPFLTWFGLIILAIAGIADALEVHGATVVRVDKVLPKGQFAFAVDVSM